jgi:hypothetical protein
MKFDTQTKKNMLSSKVTKAEVTDRIQEGRCRHVGTSSTRYEMDKYYRTLMKIGTQAKQIMLIECKSHKLRQKNSKN